MRRASNVWATSNKCPPVAGCGFSYKSSPESSFYIFAIYSRFLPQPTGKNTQDITFWLCCHGGSWGSCKLREEIFTICHLFLMKFSPHSVWHWGTAQQGFNSCQGVSWEGRAGLCVFLITQRTISILDSGIAFRMYISAAECLELWIIKVLTQVHRLQDTAQTASCCMQGWAL